MASKTYGLIFFQVPLLVHTSAEKVRSLVFGWNIVCRWHLSFVRVSFQISLLVCLNRLFFLHHQREYKECYAGHFSTVA